MILNQTVCPFCYTIFECNASYIFRNSGVKEQVKGNDCLHCGAYESVGMPLTSEGFDLRFVGNKIWLQKNPNAKRRHKFFTTWTGIEFHPFEATEAMIDIRDIAHACSIVPRFGGHLDCFYSSGQHQLVVSEHCSSKNKLKGLLHDSTDGYMGDIVSPMKYHPFMLHYRAYESQLLALIFNKYGLTPDIPEEVHSLDKAAEASECRDMSNKEWYKDSPLILPMKMSPRPMKEIEEEYLYWFERLTK